MTAKSAIPMRRLPTYDRSQLAVAGYAIKCLVVVTATFRLSVCPLNRMKTALTLLYTNLVLSLLTLFHVLIYVSPARFTGTKLMVERGIGNANWYWK